AHAKEEAEVVPAPAVVRFVDAHLGGDEANEERDRHDEPVPQSGQKASGRGARYAVLGTRSRNGEEIGHWSPRVVRGDYCGPNRAPPVGGRQAVHAAPTRGNSAIWRSGSGPLVRTRSPGRCFSN